MVSKRLCCAVLLLSLFTFDLYAQAADANQSASNSQNENSELNQSVQKFTWDNMGDVLKYGISIEKYDSKKEDFVLCYEHETNEEESRLARMREPARRRARRACGMRFAAVVIIG